MSGNNTTRSTSHFLILLHASVQAHARAHAYAHGYAHAYKHASAQAGKCVSTQAYADAHKKTSTQAQVHTCTRTRTRTKNHTSIIVTNTNVHAITTCLPVRRQQHLQCILRFAPPTLPKGLVTLH